jgi:hypothetical protein
MPLATRLVVGGSITLEQPVYVPGNDHQGMWASPLLETFFGPEPKWDPEDAFGKSGGLSIKGDLELAVFVTRELRRSYSELPIRWICDLDLRPRDRRYLVDR